MPYTRENWIQRVGARMDFPGQVTHLTRRAEIDGKPASGLDVLVKILGEQKLVGSSTASGFVVGPRRAVCFQEVPLYSVVQNLNHEASLKGKLRYDHFGLMFPKDYVFVRGGRPVIYDRTDDAKQWLREDQWWRIVRFDLSDTNNYIDWTHEREWRVPDDLSFDLSEAFVLVPNREGYHSFLNHPRQMEQKLVQSNAGIVTLSPVFY